MKLTLRALAVGVLVVAMAAPAGAVTVVNGYDVSITKSGSPASVLPGENITYTLAVAHTGAGAESVVVTDTLPAELSFVSGQWATGNGGTCSHDGSATGGVITCDLGAMFPPFGGVGVQNHTITVVATANHTAATTCVNTAMVRSFLNGDLVEDANPGNDGPVTASTACEVPQPLGAIGDFVWHDLDGDGAQDPGEPGIGGVTVTLSGGPGGTSVTAADGIYPLFSNLPAGNYTVTVNTATAPAGMVPTTPTSVSVTLAGGQVFLDADFGFRVPPPTVIDLELTKDVNQATVPVGTNVTWTITVVNKGPAAATGVSVSDSLPSGVSYVSDNGAGAFNPATATWTIGNLAVGASASLQITTSVDQAGVWVNEAQVATANEQDVDSTPGNNVASEDDQDSAEVGTVLAATTTTTTTVADTLVKTGPREQTLGIGAIGLASVLMGMALVLAARRRGTD